MSLTKLESTAERKELGFKKLEQMAASDHPYSSAIAALIADKGERLHDELVFASGIHEGEIFVHVQGTSIFGAIEDPHDESDVLPVLASTI